MTRASGYGERAGEGDAEQPASFRPVLRELAPFLGGRRAGSTRTTSASQPIAAATKSPRYLTARRAGARTGNYGLANYTE